MICQPKVKFPKRMKNKTILIKNLKILCHIIFIDIILYISYVRNLKTLLNIQISLSNIKSIENVYKKWTSQRKNEITTYGL